MSECFHSTDPNIPPTPITEPSTVTHTRDHRLDAKIDPKHLYCSEEQYRAIATLSTSADWVAEGFSSSQEHQVRATSLLQRYSLDQKSLNDLASKWSVARSNSWARRDSTIACRVLYQCVCGYSSCARRKGKKQQPPTHQGSTLPSSPSTAQDEGERRAAYDFTGCLAHIDITTIRGGTPGSVIVTRILGYPVHNQECLEAKLVRFPSIPLHPHVREIALRQMRKGASITTIQSENLLLMKSHAYRDQHVEAEHPLTSNYRYLIRSGDFSRLYRDHLRATYGIDVRIRPEHNVHNWLDPKSKYFRTALYNNVFHYAARQTEDERWILCIATQEMNEAAWRYCHKQQLLLDGTFGLCTARVLLWIAMGVDELGSGIPVALFLFSAPTGNKATHAGYNTSILAELLGTWRRKLGEINGQPFTPYTAMTDTDLKERGALVTVWPNIILLLCRFHVRQCWTNKRKTLKISSGPSLWHHRLRCRLLNLEEVLLETTQHSDALALIEAERRECERLRLLQDVEAKAMGDAGLSFLQYLRSQWVSVEIWRSWSRFGREKAASRLGIPIGKVLTTTNHLESLNGSLKGKYLKVWQRSGHRLRFDILVYHLIYHILPHIYARHRTDHQFLQWRTERFLAAAGGGTIDPQHRNSKGTPYKQPLAWFAPDQSRDSAAQSLFAAHLIKPIASRRPYEHWARCQSESSPGIHYWLSAHPSGCATCSCTDWTSRGGACKHLRAFRLLIEYWERKGALDHPFTFPSSLGDAEDVRIRNTCWYGHTYTVSVTHPPSASSILDGSLALSNRLPPENVSNPPLHMFVAIGDTGAPICLPPPTVSEDQLPSLVSEAELCSDREVLYSEDAVGDSGDLSQSQDRPRQYDENQNALSTQLQQHIDHDINTVLPQLHGILANLNNPAHLQLRSSEAIAEFRSVLGALEDAFATELYRAPEFDAEIEFEGKSTENESIAFSGQKRILPPSPEPHQKRKKSYRTL